MPEFPRCSFYQGTKGISAYTEDKKQQELKMKNPIEIKDLNAPELDAYARISEVQLLRYYEPYLRTLKIKNNRS